MKKMHRAACPLALVAALSLALFPGAAWAQDASAAPVGSLVGAEQTGDEAALVVAEANGAQAEGKGVRTIPWTSLSDQSLARPILPRTHPAERLLLAALVVEADVLVQQLHERLHGDAAPVPMVEELVLEAAEEAFASRVVRAAALSRHGPGQAVSLAYADPAGPSVMASPDALLNVKSNSRVRFAFL